MSIKVSIVQLDGSAVAEAGTADHRTIAGNQITQGIHKAARGSLVCDEDGIITFVADDSDEFDAVVAADA